MNIEQRAAAVIDKYGRRKLNCRDFISGILRNNNINDSKNASTSKSTQYTQSKNKRETENDVGCKMGHNFWFASIYINNNNKKVWEKKEPCLRKIRGWEEDGWRSTSEESDLTGFYIYILRISFIWYENCGEPDMRGNRCRPPAAFSLHKLPFVKIKRLLRHESSNLAHYDYIEWNNVS